MPIQQAQENNLSYISC